MSIGKPVQRSNDALLSRPQKPSGTFALPPQPYVMDSFKRSNVVMTVAAPEPYKGKELEEI